VDPSGSIGLDRLLIGPSATVRDSLAAIDSGSANAAIAVNDSDYFVGIVTDGDLRRALLGGATLDDSVASYLRTKAVTVPPLESRASVLDLMQARSITQVPVVADDGRVVGVHLLRELLGRVARPNIAVVLAGGKGTRLRPLTGTIPKPMVVVAGRPILERIVAHLVGYGITEIVMAIGYFGEQIEAHFRDGQDHGCSISYLREDPEHPLGTGGPLATLEEVTGALTRPVLVMNGDLVTQFDVAALLNQHAATQAVVTVAVHTYTDEVPFGVITTNGAGMITSIAEKPIRSETVSAGIYVLNEEVLPRIPAGRSYPITDLVLDCLDRGEKIATWHCGQDWVDVGRPHDLSRARGME
jgi:dTDP-glucose pyrophosphorylase